jgi:hypothetical protein
MSQAAVETKTTDQSLMVDERLTRIDRAMPATRKAPTLYKGFPID